MFKFGVSSLGNYLVSYVSFLVLQMYRRNVNIKMHNISVVCLFVCLLGIPELEALLATRRSDVHYAGSRLVRQLKRRDALISKREKQNDVITAYLQAVSEKRSKY